MRFGVLDFSYATFEPFAKAMRVAGAYSVNLGDYAQTIAARHAYAQLGVPAEHVVPIDRDTLNHYRGEPTVLLMNGHFHERSLPAAEGIRPLFAGFSALEPTFARHHAWLKGFAPIGCRDPHTAHLARTYGIEAATTGCVTLTLPRREHEPAHAKLFVVYGSGAGTLPASVIKQIPDSLADVSEFVFHRAPAHEHPLPEATRRGLESYERQLLRRLRDEATLVLTPLHHVAAPCMAMGIPVVICRTDNDPRFGLLSDLTPIYTPDAVHRIDWAPKRIDVTELRQQFLSTVDDLLREARRLD